MAARNRRRRRKRKGSFSFLYKLLMFFVICGAIVAALAVFFKVDTIEVTGNSRYTQQEIADSGGIHVGDNLFLINKFSAAEAITRKLPYISSVRISRKLPDTLCIAVEENGVLCAIEGTGGDWLLSSTGKVVEQGAAGEGVTRITGLTAVEPEVGKPLQVPAEQTEARDSLLRLLQALGSKNALSRCSLIHLEDSQQITLRFDGRFDVLMAWDADFDYKLECLLAVVDTKLEANEKGTIDLKRKEIRFIPG